MSLFKVRGFEIHQQFLDIAEQTEVLECIRNVAKTAPVFRPITPSGHSMSVRMTSAGKFGWYSDAAGHRYCPKHPNGTDWPEIPKKILDIWFSLTGVERKPECCLINYYGQDAKMGMHQDKDEADFNFPVVSISLGDEGLLRMGSNTRGGKTESIWLKSGDVVVMGGAARMAYHGVDRIRFGSSRLLPNGGRVNLTLRVVE